MSLRIKMYFLVILCGFHLIIIAGGTSINSITEEFENTNTTTNINIPSIPTTLTTIETVDVEYNISYSITPPKIFPNTSSNYIIINGSYYPILKATTERPVIKTSSDFYDYCRVLLRNLLIRRTVEQNLSKLDVQFLSKEMRSSLKTIVDHLFDNMEDFFNNLQQLKKLYESLEYVHRTDHSQNVVSLQDKINNEAITSDVNAHTQPKPDLVNMNMGGDRPNKRAVEITLEMMQKKFMEHNEKLDALEEPEMKKHVEKIEHSKNSSFIMGPILMLIIIPALVYTVYVVYKIKTRYIRSSRLLDDEFI